MYTPQHPKKNKINKQYIMSTDKRIDKISHQLVKLASGDFNTRLSTSEALDDIDAIILGINMLGEELQAVTVSRDYLGSVYTGIVDLLIVLDKNDRIQQVNTAVVENLLYKESELRGKHISVLFAKENVQSISDINKNLEKEKHAFNIELVFLAKNKKKFPFSCSCSLFYDNFHKVQGKLYILKDISAIKKTEAQLKVKNEELNTLIYRASHDLKGPLSSMLGLINLSKQEQDGQEVRNYLDLIELSTRRLDAILGAFTEIDKVAKTALRISTINFQTLIKEILVSIENIPDFQSVKFSVLVNQKKSFYSDVNLLRSVLQNLIENGIKYRRTDIQATMNIRVTGTKSGIKIEVSDNGIGIPEKMQQEIFKLFYRAHAVSNGSGLGLYIVKSSVEKLGGKVSVQSKEKNGTVFAISIPNAKEPETDIISTLDSPSQQLLLAE